MSRKDKVPTYLINYKYLLLKYFDYVPTLSKKVLIGNRHLIIYSIPLIGDFGPEPMFIQICLCILVTNEREHPWELFMQSSKLCVLVHIWCKLLHQFDAKLSAKNFFVTTQSKRYLSIPCSLILYKMTR